MKKRKEVIICMVFLLLVSLAIAIDSDVDGWQLDPGDILLINVHEVCKIVTNFDTVSSFFVPTFTSGEWDAFINNPPENVSVVEYIDCNGDCFGTASEDNCETCVGGNTGVDACVQDCADEWGGSAWDSDCGCVAADNSGDDCDDCAGTPPTTALPPQVPAQSSTNVEPHALSQPPTTELPPQVPAQSNTFPSQSHSPVHTQPNQEYSMQFS